ncbi:2OG-Fe(II) oxygenase [Streptomyces sp. H34-S4]|uniref:2OG-Fe(II) oxygenase n=1 Tax=Streptomyces sp. H34-S4 TaxID=2996463 RepID=UPI002271F600|nr:2OG-Fe(II) oxygenase [Streptomyces sp. H34-S4]MCY0937348.1 2OG-Fe(II) oxygenase [Streptomyces sp. H34-S4]
MNLASVLDAPATGPAPHIHSRGDRFVVIDDLLPEADFAAATADFSALRLKPVLSTIDPVYDGFAYRAGEDKQPLATDAADTPRWQRAVKEQVTAHLDVVAAREDDDSLALGFSAWGYPAGSRLSWHNDAGAGRVGAYVYFTHANWDASWGGGLALIDEESRADAADGAALVHSPVHPTLILPRPNRLVVFRAHTMHAVQRVDSAAGDRLRRTWTGFITEGKHP